MSQQVDQNSAENRQLDDNDISDGDHPNAPVEMVDASHCEQAAGDVSAAQETDWASEAAAQQDRALRLQAEMENLRRRTSRELADVRRYAGLPMARDLLEVLDNVDRAVTAAEKDQQGEGLLEGVRLMRQQVRDVLKRHAVESIPALGEPFDPNLHEAILQQPSEDEAGTVIMVTQEGFQLHDRIVRPAQVIVSSGPAA